MSSFRIRRDGREYLVEDEASLVRLARSGALLGEDKLREEPEGLWTDANLHPQLWEIFQADPWAAWDDLDEVEDAEELWNTLTRSASMANRPEPPAAPSPKVKPPEDEDAETLAPMKPRGLPVASKSRPTKKPFRPPRRRKPSSVSTGARWAGPTKSDGVKPVTGGDLKPGVRVERPAGLKLNTLTPPDSAEQDADSGAIKIKVPGAIETRVVPPVDMMVEPRTVTPTPPTPPAPTAPDVGATITPTGSGLPELNLPKVGPRGQVIAFPAPGPVGGSRGGAQPAEKALEDPTLPPRIVRASIPADEPVRAFRTKAPERQTTTFSLVRVVPVLLLFGAVIAVAAWWIQLQSQQTFDNIPVVDAPRPPGEEASGAEGGAADGTTVEVPGEAKVYSRDGDEPEFMRELRRDLPVDRGDITTAEELEEALFFDLARLHILGVKVQAEIVEFAGDEENPVPDKVTIAIQADSFGEPDRELAAIGLVVGKYITLQHLDVLVFKVQLLADNGKGWKRQPSGERAGALYSRDLSVTEYLSD